VIDVGSIDWEKMNGLIPAVVQDAGTGRLLMLAFMNREALDRTIQTGKATFWSRTRNMIWCKGETSGNFLAVRSLHLDCDKDSVLVVAAPAGPTCHTGRKSCFLEDGELVGPEFLGHLERLIARRREDAPEGSYTARLFREGMAKIAKKVGEEAVEVVVSAGQERRNSVEETADLLYHLLVFLNQRDIRLDEVMGELQRRHLNR